MAASEERKIYILDTNVLIHDPNALNRFDEHDVVLPIVVLEEMDHVKKGFDRVSWMNSAGIAKILPRDVRCPVVAACFLN